MTAKIIPCKYCKRGRNKVHHTNKIGAQVQCDPCPYCGGKGWVRVEYDENGNEIKKDITNEEPSIQ